MSYRSHADIGGQPGHGPVTPESESVRFHADWEKTALALTLAMGATGSWNIDSSRSARETLPDYARLGYYQIWIAALQKLMLERGQVFADEIAAGRMLHPGVPVRRVLAADEVAATLARGAPTLRETATRPLFHPGDRVRTLPLAAAHHTRLPGYARGKTGTVRISHGSHVFADAHAQGRGEQPQPLYTVEFEGTELWGADADPGLRVSIDAWQSYLEAA